MSGVSEKLEQPAGPRARFRGLLLAAAGAAAALTFLWFARPSTISPAVEPAVEIQGASTGESVAPRADFRLPSLDGESLGPPDFAGRTVVVDFWATWCGPCRLQAEMLEKLFEQLDPETVQFLAVNVGEDAATVRRFVAETPFPYPVLLDGQDQLLQRYGLRGLPTVMVVDPRGEVSYTRTGVVDSATLRLELITADGRL